MNSNWKQSLKGYIDTEGIDFIGINITQDDIQVKCYRTPVCAADSKSEFAAMLDEMGCCAYVTPIERGSAYEEDIRLKRRSDANMTELFKRLEYAQPSFGAYAAEAKALAAMPVCELDGYSYASLFYLCVVGGKDAPDKYKLHYLTRMCKDPDNIAEGISFRDEEYLEYIDGLKIKELSLCSAPIKRFLELSPSNLWIVGSDYDFKHGLNKYKVYVKCNEQGRLRLADALRAALEPHASLFGARLDELLDCIYTETQMRIYGFGVCCDTHMSLSLNLYMVV